MKNIYLIIFCCILSGTAYAQNIPDNHAQYRIKYNFYFKNDSTVKDYHKDNFYLDICKDQSFFYSRIKYYRDSIMQAIFAKTADVGATLDAIRSISRGVEWYTIKEFANARISMLFQRSYMVFKNEEKITIPNWKLSQDTLTVLGYLCNKATAYFKGREWSVWYAPSIQINDGPWLLCGLPGAILYAQDSNGYFIFQGTEVMGLNPPYSVILPHETNKTKQVNALEYKKLEESMYSNDMQYINQMSGVLKVEAYNSDGTLIRMKKQKFILLIKY